MTDETSETNPNIEAVEAAMWRALYRIERKERPQTFEQLLLNLNVEEDLLLEACDRLRTIGAIEKTDDGWTLTDDKWGGRVLQTTPRLEL